MAADVTLQALATQPAPLDYLVPGAAELRIKSLKASFDGTSASGAWVPCVQILVAGLEDATYPYGQTLAVGAQADVTWFPGVKPQPPGIVSLNLLFQQTLTSNAPSFSFPSIPQNFQHLWIMAVLRTDFAGNVDHGALVFNGDTTTVYQNAAIIYQNVAGGYALHAYPHLLFASAIGATGDAGHFSASSGTIYAYSVNGAYKTYTGTGTGIPVSAQTATYFAEALGGAYDGNALPITSLTIVPDTGTNFVSGSSIKIYGL